jgi:PBP1b-binding outer membrane lipoprotein LpoB
MKPDSSVFIEKKTIMKRFLSYCMYILLFASCSTLKWKRNYAAKNMLSFQKKYSSNNEFILSFPNGETLDTTAFKKINRKKFKKNVAILEKSFALVPDSVSINNIEIDSFYKNPNKISFVLEKKMKTNHIYFYK